MSQFVLLTRLGITRGWRMHLVNKVRIYTSSLLHCMFIFLVLRAKLFRSGFWVISYFISCFLKKYVVHTFFWRLPFFKRSRGLKLKTGIKFQFRRKTFAVDRAAAVRVLFGPNKQTLNRIRRGSVPYKYGKKKRAPIGKESAYPWQRNRLFLMFCWNTLEYLPIRQFLTSEKSGGTAGLAQTTLLNRW